MIDRKTAPALALPDKVIIADPDTITLNNGIPLYIINGGTQEVARIEFLFHAGASSGVHPLVATFANELIDEGTASKSSLEIASLFDYYGAHIQTECNADYASVTLYTLNKFLNETLSLLIEIIYKAAYPEPEISTFISQEKQRLATNLEKVDYLARRNFNSALYINHIYGYFPEEKDYDSVNKAELSAFHHGFYKTGVMGVLAAGRFSAEDIRYMGDAIDASGLQLGNSRPYPPLPPYLPVEKHVDKPGAVQNAIRVGKRLFNRSHPDYPGMMVVNTILGGYFGSRLMANIREDKGFTYGIGSALVSLKNDGYFFIATEVGSEVCKAALQEIKNEVVRMQDNVVPEEELNLVKNYLTGTFQRSIDGPFALAERFKTVLLSGLNNDYYRQYLDTVKNINSQQIQAMARQHLLYSEMTVVSVGQNYL